MQADQAEKEAMEGGGRTTPGDWPIPSLLGRIQRAKDAAGLPVITNTA